MVNAIDLLLFGSSSVISQNGMVVMDDWCVCVCCVKMINHLLVRG